MMQFVGLRGLKQFPLLTLVLAVAFSAASALAADESTDVPAGDVTPTSTDDGAADEPLAICLDYIPDDAAFFFALRPKGLFGRRELKVVADFLEVGGPYQHPVPVTQLEQITFVAEPRDEGIGSNESTLIFDLNILRTTKPLDFEGYVAKITGAETENVEGSEEKFYTVPDGRNICIWFPDDRTYVAGPRDSIERAILRHEETNTKPPAETSWPAIGSSQVAAVFSSSYMHKYLTEYLDNPNRPSPGVAVGVSILRELIKDTDAFSMALHHDAERSLPIELRMTLGCGNEELLATKQEGLKRLLFVLKQYVNSQNAEGRPNAEEQPRLTDMGDELFANVAETPRGSSAVLTISVDTHVGLGAGFIVGLLGDLGGFQGTYQAARMFNRTALAAEPVADLSVPAGVLDSPRLVERRRASAEHLQQIAVALEAFREAHGRLPDLARLDGGGQPLLSWRVHLLPFLGHEELYDEFRLDEAWDSEHNQSLRAKMPAVYGGPPRGEGATVGENTAVYLLSGDAARVPDDDADADESERSAAPSDILLVEARFDQPWTKPGDSAVGEGPGSSGAWRGLHPGGLMICDGAGASRFVSTDEFNRMMAPLDQAASETASGGEQ